MLRRIVLSVALCTVPSLLAQSAETTVHTVADLTLHEVKVAEAAKASPKGFGVETLENGVNDYTLLVVRVHTGDAERHQFFADQIVILKGSITLVTGGVMQNEQPNPASTRPGETLGSQVTGGKEIVLRAGDIARIPAGIPHWVKVVPGTPTTYLVFKEK
jgi:mannose-6-phosphate isomerase-like protein (cupin superfamily)